MAGLWGRREREVRVADDREVSEVWEVSTADLPDFPDFLEICFLCACARVGSFHIARGRTPSVLRFSTPSSFAASKTAVLEMATFVQAVMIGRASCSWPSASAIEMILRAVAALLDWSDFCPPRRSSGLKSSSLRSATLPTSWRRPLISSTTPSTLKLFASGRLA